MAINTAVCSPDTKELLVLYNSLELADITVKLHFNFEDGAGGDAAENI